jgi:hypothetical protein
VSDCAADDACADHDDVGGATHDDISLIESWVEERDVVVRRLARRFLQSNAGAQQVKRAARPRILAESWDAPQLAERLDRARRFRRPHVTR